MLLAEISLEESFFDLMGDFAIRTDAGECKFPTIVTGYWESIPLGSAEVWFVAYNLLQRKEKADFLYSHLMKFGANPLYVELMVKQPISTELRQKLNSLPQN